jgi:beta-lactamase superfamily II metal-dependent hydrolase
VSSLRAPSDGAGPLRLHWALAFLLLVVASCGRAQEQHGTTHATAAVGESTVGFGLGAAAAEVDAGPDATGHSDAAALEIVFFDVGHGDAVLIRPPTGQTPRYDGGEGRVDLLPKLRGLDVDELSLVIASHKHADHIGDLPEVIRFYRPRFVMASGIPHTTRTYERFLQAIEAAGSQLLEPTRRSIRLGRLSFSPPATWQVGLVAGQSAGPAAAGACSQGKPPRFAQRRYA